MKTLRESLLDDQEEVMNQMDKGAIVAEYNLWLRRNATQRNLKITEKDVEFIDGMPVVEHPSSMIDIRELPPCKVVLKRIDDIHASIGNNKMSTKVGVTMVQQMQILREIIEQSNGYEITEFRLDNRYGNEKSIDSSVLTALGPIDIKHAVMWVGESTVKLPYIWRCKNLDIYCEGHGDVYMNGIPAGMTKLNIIRK